MGKLKIISLKSAEKIIEESRKNMIYFKNKNRSCYLSYKNVIKKYLAYNQKFFYKKLKPYILFEKNNDNLIKEDWIKESKEHKKRSKELLEIEKYNFFVICAGDNDVYENTFGYPYNIIEN